MRFIDTSELDTTAFEALAVLKRAELEALDPTNSDNYKDFLDLTENAIWNTIKTDLENLSNKKCWYTEAFAGLSDFQVDHFRPKKRVSLIKPFHKYNEARKVACKKGYWWLSYDVTNYRLSGGKPNNKKRNYFPLRSDSPVAAPQDDSWKTEIPIILDPCIETDPALLNFSGTIPEPSNPDATSIENIRAKISIRVYDLDSEKLKKPKSEIYEIVLKVVSQGQRFWDLMKVHKGVNPPAYTDALGSFAENCVLLVSFLNPEKRQFTRMIFCYYKSQTNEWIKDHVLGEAAKLGYV
jgi:hypothetical protein